MFGSFQGTVSDVVCGMVRSSHAQSLVRNRGLNIVNVSWEDCARNKACVWGPCISDMTLLSDGRSMPVIRYPNYEDQTWDVRMDDIQLLVGNQLEGSEQAANGGTLYPVTLTDFLNNIGLFCSCSQRSLLAPSRDSHVLASAQACFLPVPQGGEAQFQVQLYNYQSSMTDPAVLVIVATSKGTSVQVADGSRPGQKLWFNDHGTKRAFKAVRLKDDRAAHGRPLEGAVTQQEKQDNLVFIIQVPLRQKQPPAPTYLGAFGGSSLGAAYDTCAFGASNPFCAPGACPAPQAACFGAGVGQPQVDVEHAIVGLGEAAGRFPKLRGGLERDDRYPVRLTLQYYKCTSNGAIDAGVVDEIAKQIQEARSVADFFGSLVTTQHSGRPTEPRLLPRPTAGPWTNLWGAEGLRSSYENGAGTGNINSNGNVFKLSPSPPPVAPFTPPAPVPAVPAVPVPGARVHKDVVCDGCGHELTSAVRYKCLQCPNYDLCPDCEERNGVSPGLVHNAMHLFIKMRAPAASFGSSNHLVVNRSHLVHTNVRCSACGVCPIVGIRHQCLQCPHVSLCEACEPLGHAEYRHPMMRVYVPGTAPVVDAPKAQPGNVFST